MSKRAYPTEDSFGHKKKKINEEEIIEIAKLERDYHRLLLEMNNIATKINLCLQEIKNRVSETSDAEYSPAYKTSTIMQEQKWMPYIL